MCDHEGTTPFDLARDNANILKILHKANSEKDLKQDKQRQKCANCGKTCKLRPLVTKNTAHMILQ